MRKIDFLSEYPRFFIFEQEVNKTTFGGILFLLYAIIMLIISISYILLYALNDKYEIEFLTIKNQTLTKNSDELDKDPDLNPTLEFKYLVPIETWYNNLRIVIVKDNEIQIKTFDYIYIDSTGKKRGIAINSSVSKFQAALAYFCGNDSTCLQNEEKDSIKENTSIKFEFETPFKKIDHQNDSKPVSDNFVFFKNTHFDSFFNLYLMHTFHWKVIKYVEKKGLSKLFDKIFGLKSEYFTGDYKSEESRIENKMSIKEVNGSYYKLLIYIEIRNEHQEYDEYRRKEITILDVLSTISALFAPIKLVFLFIYGFYSTNFNNYKIIESILKKDINLLINKGKLMIF